MPLKWKMYYYCCWFQLLYLIGLIILTTYFVFFSGEVSSDGYSLGGATIGFIAVVTYKPLLSLKLVQHLKKKAAYSNTESVFFDIGFALTIIIILMVPLFIFQLAELSQNAGQIMVTVSQIMLPVLFFMASLYLLIFDMSLKKAIRKQNFVK